MSRLPPAPARWQQELAAAVRDPAELLEILDLPPALLEPARRAARRFPLLVPRSFLRRMRPGDPRDPLLRQVLPLGLEEREVAGFRRDPLEEAAALSAPGVLRKYAGRALLLAAPSCAVHCRYCFRRHFPYGELPRGLEAWEGALAAIERDPSIHEVILSGGDPLVLSDATLEELARRVAAIAHVRRLRLHTRLPVVLPSRVGAPLLGWLRATRLAPVVVVHANHPAELTRDCPGALSALSRSGIPLLNQAVLLRGVNDDARTLAELCERLADLGVIPYYLHQADPVAGTAHFRVSERRGRALAAELSRRLPGYAVPRYVKEVPGEAAKVPLRP